MKKMVIVQIDFRTLTELLQLPHGAVIEDLWTPHESNGVVAIKLSGVGIEVEEGHIIFHAPIGESNRTDEGGIEIDWKLPI